MARPAFDQAKMQRIIQALRDAISANGRAPTRRELAIAAEVPTSTCQRYLNHLAEAGLIEREPAAWRGLRFRT